MQDSNSPNKNLTPVRALAGDRPIAFKPILGRALGGGLNEALFLSQACFWSNVNIDSDGWFFTTSEEWEEQTMLSRYQQDKAREFLKREEVLEEKKEGLPCRLFYRVNFQVLESKLKAYCGEQECEKLATLPARNSHTSLRETNKQGCEKLANIHTENPYETPYEMKDNTPPKGERASFDQQAGFNAFWRAHPKKKGKDTCERVYKRKIRTQEAHDRLMAGLERAKRSQQWQSDEGKWIPYPATWINAGGQDDEDVDLSLLTDSSLTEELPKREPRIYIRGTAARQAEESRRNPYGLSEEEIKRRAELPALYLDSFEEMIESIRM